MWGVSVQEALQLVRGLRDAQTQLSGGCYEVLTILAVCKSHADVLVELWNSRRCSTRFSDHGRRRPGTVRERHEFSVRGSPKQASL